jgi:alkanesulfonate monooxygenase SsuD/methylene tetrahydromethanopterin reductase-like flavin-dependent oxidoreductase (luciferase family)
MMHGYISAIYDHQGGQRGDDKSFSRPLQAHLPILVGGSGPRKTLPLVARWADHWNAYGSPEEFARTSAILDERCADIGRDPASIERSVNLDVAIRDTRDGAEQAWAATLEAHQPPAGEAALDAAGSPADVAAAIRPYLAAGVDQVIFVLRSPWDVESITRLAEVRAALGA